MFGKSVDLILDSFDTDRREALLELGSLVAVSFSKSIFAWFELLLLFDGVVVEVVLGER